MFVSSPATRFGSRVHAVHDESFEFSEMLEFIRDRVLGDFRGSNRTKRNPTTQGSRYAFEGRVGTSRPVDSEHKGVISSDVRRTLADTVTDLDTRDAMEACAGVTGDLEKAECFVTFGVAPEADLWYSVVHGFEELLKYDTDPLEESVHNGSERV